MTITSSAEVDSLIKKKKTISFRETLLQTTDRVETILTVLSNTSKCALVFALVQSKQVNHFRFIR